MRIDRIKLKNFRSHEVMDIQLDKDLIGIWGPNGAGKTNILEAIHILSVSKSPRAQYDRDIINHDQSFCSIEGLILTSEDEVQLEVLVTKNTVYENASSKKVKVNKLPKTVNFFTGLFNTVLFTPQDIMLPSASPSHKRQYLDLILSQVSSDYKRQLSLYTKAVKQRNKVLEQILETGKGHDQIDYWNIKLIETGGAIQKARSEVILFLENHLQKEIENLNGINTKININYDKNEVNIERFEQFKNREIFAKSTLIGPHRDNFNILVNDYDIGEFGSRGQQRTIVLALKLGEIDYIEEKKGERPVLLLDDIFSELDEEHKIAVSKVINRQQTIITGTEIPDFLTDLDIKNIELKK